MPLYSVYMSRERRVSSPHLLTEETAEQFNIELMRVLLHNSDAEKWWVEWRGETPLQTWARLKS